MKEENEDNYLALWLSGELDKESYDRFKASGEMDKLSSIINEMDSWSLPELKNENALDVHTKVQPAKIVPLYKKLSFQIAASIILLVGIFFIFKFSGTNLEYKEISCNAGETKEVTLPDNTAITLFGKSTIKYNESGFNNKREVAMNGSAYFEVTKSGPFKVNFDKATLEVLGTKFRIIEGKELSTVNCFEGKVKVSNESETSIITKDESLRIPQKGSLEKYSSNENTGENKPLTTFRNTHLSEVINSISIYYDVDFRADAVDLNRNFSGEFTTQNLDTALKMVLLPMNIQFEKNGREITLSNID